MPWSRPPDASPGLLRRRYSVPETIMRKYRLAQLRSDSDESEAVTAPTPAQSSCGFLCDARRARHDMRRSAMMRRLWTETSCRCDYYECRSLDASPKRQRLEPPPTINSGSDEMLRVAITNNYRERVDRQNDTADSDDQPPKKRKQSVCIYVDSFDSPSVEVKSETVTSTDAPSPSRARSDSTLETSEPNSSHTAHSHTDDSSDSRSVDEPTCVAKVVENRNDIKNKTKEKTAEQNVEILEIIVSESIDSDVSIDRDRPANRIEPKSPCRDVARPPRKFQPVDLDQYVSNILVESLNSLTDQIEEMNASMGGDRKISIVEKEIKVKLQNTGMNTIVHLSPTSNNPIIFGNEELHDKKEIDVDTYCEEECENEAAVVEVQLRGSDTATSTDNINKSVLAQIQRLFHERLEPEGGGGTLPEISHIEISNVDVFIDDAGPCAADDRPLESETRPLGEVGAGTYFEEPSGAVIVPRFSAFPHTESMEVNASSASDPDALGSGCTSLVDSLDDPSSPRNVMLRRARRGELVRSAIDVLDLLPEMSRGESRARERSEAFFIRIRDDDFDCDKENVVVADRLPDTIRQRLYRRHRNREMRMEHAKRRKSKLIRGDLEKQMQPENNKSRREIEKECSAILQSLIDEVLAKIVQEEYKYAKIKNKANKKISQTLTAVNQSTKTIRKTNELSNLESFKVASNGDVNFVGSSATAKPKNSTGIRKKELPKTTEKTAFNKQEVSERRGPRRFYQKSEIHDGKKCIEILEILEYGTDSSQSSPDADCKRSSKNVKSRIPIPISEPTMHKPNGGLKWRLARSSPNLAPSDRTRTKVTKNGDDVNENISSSKYTRAPTRRASVPQQEPHRDRFRQTFAAIPEERSSLSIESSSEDVNLNRRVRCEANDNARQQGQLKSPAKLSKSTSTSPAQNSRSVKTVATSPISSAVDWCRPAGVGTDKEDILVKSETRSTYTQYDAIPTQNTVRTIETGASIAQITIDHDKTSRIDAKQNGKAETTRGSNKSKSDESRRERSRSEARVTHSLSDSRVGTRALAKNTGAARSREVVKLPARSEDSDSDDSPIGSLASPKRVPGRRQRRPTNRSKIDADGGWSVTVAGNCRTALPTDVEMRLRFPTPAAPACRSDSGLGDECRRRHCRECACVTLPPPDTKLKLVMKQSSGGSSILGSKSVKKRTESLPEVSPHRTTRSNKSKGRRPPSLHCWLPAGPAPVPPSESLAVLGCAIVPENKPRAPTMSERDLTRLYTPRHYLRL